MINIELALALMRVALLLLSPFISASLVLYFANRFLGSYARFKKYTTYFWIGLWGTVGACYATLFLMGKQLEVFDLPLFTIALAGSIGLLCRRNIQQVAMIYKVVLSVFLLLCFMGLLWLFYVTTEWLWGYLHAYLVTLPQWNNK